MKNFKTPLAIVGTATQLFALLRPLSELGYKVPSPMPLDYQDFLVTNFGGSPWEVGALLNDYRYKKGRTIVDAKNTELVLALAAMVDEDRFYADEYVISLSSNQFPKGHIKKITLTDGKWFDIKPRQNNDSGTIFQTGLPYARKATAEELIKRFTLATPDSGCYKVAVSDDCSGAPSKGVLISEPFLKEIHGKLNDGRNKETAEKIEKEFPRVFPDTVTYKRGDRFINDGHEYILAQTDTVDCIGGKMHLICIESGNRYMNKPAEVRDIQGITKPEFPELFDGTFKLIAKS